MRIFFGLLFVMLLASSCSVLKTGNGSKNNGVGKTASSSKSYDKIIPQEAISQTGLFAVHQVGDKYFFEIADSLLNREILVVTRFIKTPAGAGNYGGEEIGEKTIIWEKGPSNNIFLRISTLVSVADEEDAISKAVNNSNVTPILEAFDIAARNTDKNASLIEVTNFINGENTLLALSDTQKDAYKLSTLEKNKSYIKGIKSFPINTEIRTVKTYKAKTTGKSKKELPAAVLAGVVTLEINNSFSAETGESKVPATVTAAKPYF